MKNFRDPFQFLYESMDNELSQLLGENYRPEGEFNHGDWVRVAQLKSQPDNDGRDVEIYEVRYPARFFKIKVLPTPNSVGEISTGFCLSTGSGCDRLAFDIAKAAQNGMIGFHKEEQ